MQTDSASANGRTIIFVNRFFAPDLSATSQILSDLAFYLAGYRDVCVVASQQTYSDPAQRLPSFERINGVRIYRVASTHFGRFNLIGRAIDYLSFYCSAYRTISRVAKPGDIVVAMTDPPLLSVIVMLVAWWRKVLLVNWLQDVYPEIAGQLSIPFLNGIMMRALMRMRDKSLKVAASNVVLETRMANYVAGRGVAKANIRVIQNWGDDDRILPVAAENNPIRRDWGLGDKFVIGYSGNLGRAHEFDTILRASLLLEAEKRIVFLVIGGGYKFNELADRVKQLGIDHLYRFQPYQDRGALNYSLCVPDIHWISLNPELEGFVVPSKFYGIAAAGRPIITISSSDGDLANWVRRYDCGVVIAPGDATGLAASIRQLMADPARVSRMGRQARLMLDERFAKHRALSAWKLYLDEIDTATG